MMRRLIDELAIPGKHEQPRILLIDQLMHCHISLEAGENYYAVQSWSVEDVELLVGWLGKWLTAETGNATLDAQLVALQTQRDQLRADLAAATQRAEAAEANARQSEQTAREYRRVQEYTKKRAEAAEAQVIKASDIVYDLIGELADATGKTRAELEEAFLGAVQP